MNSSVSRKSASTRDEYKNFVSMYLPKAVWEVSISGTLGRDKDGQASFHPL